MAHYFVSEHVIQRGWLGKKSDGQIGNWLHLT